MFDLGIKARNKTTGEEGIITGRAEYLEECNKYYIAKNTDKDWIDEDNVEVIQE
jgi:hypothetical protein